MPVDVQLASRTITPNPELIQQWAEGALAVTCGSGRGEQSSLATGVRPRTASGRGFDPGEICIRVVDEDESRRLNREYRHKDASTNVLSFPAGIDLPGARILGDVVICAPVVAREADLQHKRYEHHFAHMVVHGVLHLLGYDHQADADAAAMERLEIKVLDRFGVGDPYEEE